MEEGDRRISYGGESSSRDSAGSPSRLLASRKRFSIELRPDETTIVSWKRLVKGSQCTSPPLIARKTEDSLDECFQDSKPTVIQNGLLVNSKKLECVNELVLSVAQQSRKRSKNTAKAQGEKVHGHLPSKQSKVEQGRTDFEATSTLLQEESFVHLQNLTDMSQHDRKYHKLLTYPVRSSIKKPANIGTKSEHSSHAGISNDDASMSLLNSKDTGHYRSVTIHSSNFGNHINSVATHQNYLGKEYCKQLESPVREPMTGDIKEAISTKVEPRENEATCGELPDLNLPVCPSQPVVSNCISKFQQEHMRT
ncbi:uncharacterized protein LOC120140715 [Hibiscus syriacus]|uniref:uncharacterized protein LOC120140715 n=1 Tax=Hibiscus syriacus TaxID=106335 RepID=UPI0019207EE8|nr:uncharacterized protein LOC120140715 [Hibiscus syriacus]